MTTKRPKKRAAGPKIPEFHTLRVPNVVYEKLVHLCEPTATKPRVKPLDCVVWLIEQAYESQVGHGA